MSFATAGAESLLRDRLLVQRVVVQGESLRDGPRDGRFHSPIPNKVLEC